MQQTNQTSATFNYQFIEKLKSLPYVDQIYLYGSHARSTHRVRSDIDLAIVCPKAQPQDWFTIMDIIDHADTLLKIDCVHYDTLQNQALKQAIDHDKRIIYAH